MKNIRVFFSEIFHVLVVKFSVYLNRHVFVMLFFAVHKYAKKTTTTKKKKKKKKTFKGETTFSDEANLSIMFLCHHYENTPIQIYRKFHLQKLKIFR